MSTKTTFKRIALVTVAALGLGVMSVAPSNAAAELDSISVSAASTTQLTAETLTATAVVVTASLAGKKGVDTLTVTASIVSGPAYIAPVLVFKESTTAEVAGTSPAMTVNPRDTATVTQATAKWSLYLNAPSVVGTYVVKLTPTGGVNAVSTTVSIVVSAPVVAPISATYSRIAMDTDACSASSGEWKFGGSDCVGTNNPGIYSRATDTVTATATISNANTKVSGSLIASFKLTQSNGSTNTMPTTIPWTVAITSGPGNIQMGYAGRLVTAKSVTEGTTTSGSDGYAGMFSGYEGAQADLPVYFVSDGTTGKTVITFTAGGVLIGTRTITVYGPATALVATLTAGQKTHVGVGQTSTHTITATDVNAAAATLPSGLTVKSSDTSVATATITSGVVTITGVKAGTATITVTDPATSAAATAATYTATVKANKPTTAPTITFDKTAYNVGELVTMTVNADMADSATATLFTAALVSSAAVVASGTAHTGTTHAVASGKATYKFYAPATSGAWTITGTTGADVDLATAATVTAGFDIVNAAVDAATTAAEAAEAAAQDATDAALDATTAAEAAGALAQEAVDLVTALSAEVTKLIAGVRASITYLTKLVMKLAAKK